MISRALRVAVVLVSGAASAGEPISPPRTPPALAPDYLSEASRARLRQRMARHGEDMSELLRAAVLLQRQVAAAAAKRIATAPKLSRPVVGGEEDVSAALPERFFVLQDALRNQAARVGEAALAADDAKLATAFAALTETCITCHAAYVNPPKR